MKRILIIGSNGAGKSTFSYRLAERTKLPLIHIDRLYWRNHWEVTPKQEFEELVAAQAQKPAWIIEGNNIGSLEQRLKYADTVFWFEFPSALCLWNVLKRQLRYWGKVRPDLPDQCVSKLHLRFLRDVWRFNKKNHARIAEKLEASQAQVIHFSNYKQVREYLKQGEPL
jgi:adenylate kinase family enzyme